jgi:dTDP-D-glucose 4,6-dehydratase
MLNIVKCIFKPFSCDCSALSFKQELCCGCTCSFVERRNGQGSLFNIDSVKIGSVKSFRRQLFENAMEVTAKWIVGNKCL